MPEAASMFQYVTNATYSDLARRIEQAQRVALITHDKPDGDALGSVMALCRLLAARGTAADIFLRGGLEPTLQATVGDTPYQELGDGEPGDDYDLVIVVDTGAWSQLRGLEPWLRRHHPRVIGFDHHPRGDEVASARIVRTDAPSTTAVLLPLLDELGFELTGEIGGVAEALFVGLATDTGWFRYANATAPAFEAAARLLATGVDNTRLFQMIEGSHRPARLGLTARALSSLRLERGGRVAVMTLLRPDFEATGGSVDDLTGLVNTPLTVDGVIVSILLVQVEEGRTKLSFRSSCDASGTNGGLPDDVWDVNSLAQRFGGGGHQRAAGARVDHSIDETLAQVVAMRRWLKRTAGTTTPRSSRTWSRSPICSRCSSLEVMLAARRTGNGSPRRVSVTGSTAWSCAIQPRSKRLMPSSRTDHSIGWRNSRLVLDTQ
jgi:phosphoesterase RecJ-like protein